MQKEILDLVETLLRQFEIPDQKICSYLRLFHYFLPLFAALLILVSSKTIVHITLIIIIFIFIMFICFDGCILTRLEKRFSNEDYTIMDPLLNLLNVPINNKNRYKYSIYKTLFCFLLIWIIYYIRFIYNTWEVVSMNV